MDPDVIGPILLLSPLIAAFGLVIPFVIERFRRAPGSDYAGQEKTAFFDAVRAHAGEFGGYALHAGTIPGGGVFLRLTTEQGTRLSHLAAEGVLTPDRWSFVGHPEVVTSYRMAELRRRARAEVDPGQVLRVVRRAGHVELACVSGPLEPELVLGLLVATLTGAGLARVDDGPGAASETGAPLALPL